MMPGLQLREIFQVGSAVRAVTAQITGIRVGRLQTVNTQPVDLDRLIRCMESLGGLWTEPGGALKWTPAQWAKETPLPYLLAQRIPQSRWMARKRLERAVEYLNRYGVPVNPTILLLVWERGPADGMVRMKRRKPTKFCLDGVALYDDVNFP